MSEKIWIERSLVQAAIDALVDINVKEDRILGAQGADLILRMPLTAISQAAIAQGTLTAALSTVEQALAQPSQPADVDWKAVGRLIEAHERAKQAGCTPGTSNWGAILWRAISKEST